MPEAERWVTFAEIEEHLQISKATLHRWINDKGLPAHKAGRYWRFKISEVDEWVKSGRSADNNQQKGV